MEAAAYNERWSREHEAASFDSISARLIEPETILPSQYYDRFRGRSILEGERRLMLAVLEDGIMCYQKYAGATRPRYKRLFREAESWLFHDSGSSWPFSFEAICGFFDFDPGYLRQRLQRWREHLLSQPLEARASVGRVRLRAARRHKILPVIPRRRHKAVAA